MCAYASEGCLSSQNWLTVQPPGEPHPCHVGLTFCVTLFFWSCRFPDTAGLEGAEWQEAVTELQKPEPSPDAYTKGDLKAGDKVLPAGEPVFLSHPWLWAEARGEAVRQQSRAPGSQRKSLRGRVFTSSRTVGRALEPGTAVPFMKMRAQCRPLTPVCTHVPAYRPGASWVKGRLLIS